jgi:altronate hydrolase
MKKSILKVHPDDNVIVALRDLAKGEEVEYNGKTFTMVEDIPAKHKFNEYDFATGDSLTMYGVLVGKAQYDIPAGSRISTSNVKHASTGFQLGSRKTQWNIPDVSKFTNRTFMGFHRTDGSVGTANHWLVIPLVFCENRNVEVLKDSLLDELGFARPKKYNQFAKQLRQLYDSGRSVRKYWMFNLGKMNNWRKSDRLFKNIDGVKFITHEGWLRRNEAGCASPVRPSCRLCHSFKCRRGNSFKPWLPECPGSYAGRRDR